MEGAEFTDRVKDLAEATTDSKCMDAKLWKAMVLANVARPNCS